MKKLGSTLKSQSGNIDTEQALSNKGIIGLYFCAQWAYLTRCDMGLTLVTPIIGKKYNELKAAGKSIEIIFVSYDRDESAFNNYHDSMPFLALPYSKRELPKALSLEFGLKGIPELVLLDGRTGELITTNGVLAFRSDMNVVLDYPFDRYRRSSGKDERASTATRPEKKITTNKHGHFCPEDCACLK